MVLEINSYINRQVNKAVLKFKTENFQIERENIVAIIQFATFYDILCNIDSDVIMTLL